MLIGEFTHTIDGKKRMSLPSKFRKEIGKKVIVSKGLDTCLFLYPLAQWKEFAEKLGTLSIGQAHTREFNRFMLASAVEVDIDSAGRILIPDFLYSFANLDDKAVCAGMYNRIEIWNTTEWQKSKEKIDKQVDSLAERLGEVGMI